MAIHSTVKCAALIGLFAVVLVGCGSTAPAIPPAKLVDIVNPSVSVQEKWKQRIGSGGDYAGAAFQPVAMDGIVYAAAESGRVSALALDSGDLVWRADVDQPLRSGVSVDNQSVYMATRDGQLIALDRESGAERWRTVVNREILEPAVVSGGRVLARAANGDVLSFDVVTGEQLWRYGSRVPDLSVRGSGAPLWVPGGYIVPLDDGSLVALDQNLGRALWKTQISEPRGSTPVERIVDVDTAPVLIGNRVVVGSRRGDLKAVDGQNGRVAWQRKLEAVSAITGAREELFVVQQNGHVLSVSAENGAPQWRQESLLGRRLTAPVVLGQHLVVGDLDGYLHWLELHSGDIVARTRLSRAAIFAAPQVSGDSVVVLDKKGRIARYTAAVK